MPQDLFRITAGALLRLLLSEGIVPLLVRTLGGTNSPLNAIPWVVVQVWGDPDPPRRVGSYDHLGRHRAILRRGTLQRWDVLALSRSVRFFTNITQYERTARYSCCPLSIAFTIDEGSNLSPIASHRIRHGVSHEGQNSNVCWTVSSLPVFRFSAGIPRILYVLWAPTSSGRTAVALRGPSKPPNLAGPI